MSSHHFEAWCSQHQMHPTDCFEEHNPTVTEVKGAISPEEALEALKQTHREKQSANKQND